MKRIESKGSVWLIDEDLKRYCRFPKTEGPREHPDWGNENAGPLQDAVWHDYESWTIVFLGYERLIIECPDGPISAPHPVVLS